MIFLRWLISRKHYELKIVLTTLSVLILLPLISVVVFASAGISLIGSALANLNPVTHLVEIFDPNGHKVADIELSTVWPVAGHISLEFGQPDPPYQAHHTGIDIANPHFRIGDPVTPFAAGKVLLVEERPDNPSGFGEYVLLDNGNHITSLYGHLSETLVVKDQDVKPGDVIGLEGSTGHSTGPHVHFQIMVYGIPVNPRTFMVGNPPIGPTL